MQGIEMDDDDRGLLCERSEGRKAEARVVKPECLIYLT